METIGKLVGLSDRFKLVDTVVLKVDVEDVGAVEMFRKLLISGIGGLIVQSSTSSVFILWFPVKRTTPLSYIVKLKFVLVLARALHRTFFVPS